MHFQIGSWRGVSSTSPFHYRLEQTRWWETRQHVRPPDGTYCGQRQQDRSSWISGIMELSCLPWATSALTVKTREKISLSCLKPLILVFVTGVKHASWSTLLHAYSSYFLAPKDKWHEELWAQDRAFVQFSKRIWKSRISISDFYILATNSVFEHHMGQQNWSGDHTHFCSTGFSETKTFH